MANRNPPKGMFVKWLKTPEKRHADGISGCCDRKVGATATHLAFSCLTLDPPLRGRGGANSGSNIFRTAARTAALCAAVSFFACRAKLPTRGDNGLHGGYICMPGEGVSSWHSSSPYTSSSLPSRADSKIFFQSSHRRLVLRSALYTAEDTSLRS